jgi:mannose-6-phosphate isomerase-like protein (cupin superfamily)
MTIRRKDEPGAVLSRRGESVREYFGKTVGPGGVRHSLARITISPGGSSLKHSHPEAEESYFVLSGEARIVIDGEESPLGKGDGVLIAPNREHQIFNDGAEDLEFIAVCVPPWTPDCSKFL